MRTDRIKGASIAAAGFPGASRPCLSEVLPRVSKIQDFSPIAGPPNFLLVSQLRGGNDKAIDATLTLPKLYPAHSDRVALPLPINRKHVIVSSAGNLRSGRKPTFLLAVHLSAQYWRNMERLERIREIAERVATSEGLELVDVEFKGSGPGSVLRIFLDKPGGITVGDCQSVSHQVGAILDVEDFISTSYTLEVSSPGLDRKLVKPADYQRFSGKLVKLALRGPRQGPRRYRGRLLGMEDNQVRIDTGDGQVVQVDYNDIEKANLVVEFGKTAKHDSEA